MADSEVSVHVRAVEAGVRGQVDVLHGECIAIRVDPVGTVISSAVFSFDDDRLWLGAGVVVRKERHAYENDSQHGPGGLSAKDVVPVPERTSHREGDQDNDSRHENSN